MKQILLLDDDLMTHRLVSHALNKEFEVIGTHSLKQTYDVLKQHSQLALALIDRSLPDGDGIEVCMHLRKDYSQQNIPIIFLSGLATEGDKVSGLFAGADDYMVKPFGLLELKARVMARLRSVGQSIFIGPIEIDLNTHRAFSKKDNGQKVELPLTRIEFKLLVTLAQSPDEVFSRDRLLSKVWNQDCFVTDRVVDTHISHLRKKIQGSGLSLQSLRGEGYRLHIDLKELKVAS